MTMPNSPEPTAKTSPKDQPTEPLVAGIDVGGTGIKLGIVDSQGQTIAARAIETLQQNGPADAAVRCRLALEEMAAEFRIAPGRLQRAGLATPGPLDLPSGMLLCPGNLPAWHNTPVRDLFAQELGLPVTFANDANAATWGEFWKGTGTAAHSMVMLTLGTGVGGGIILGDRLLEGANSCGAELGHTIIDCRDDAPNNTLGIRGTLEGYCGSYGIVGQAERLLAGGADSALQSVDTLTPLAIATAADAGDLVAMQVVMDTARMLAIGIVNFLHTVDPELVVIGGGIHFGGAGSELGDRFIHEVRRHCQQRMLPALRGRVQIDFAQLGSAAGYIGAAGLALQDWTG